MNVDWPVTGSWALALCMAMSLIGWALIRSAGKADEQIERQRRQRRAYEARRADWLAAIGRGYTFDAMEIKRQLDAMRAAGWNKFPLALALAAGLLLAGCRAPQAQAPAVVVPTGEHILLPAPGDVVPPLPAGEPRWWLLTPTGLSLLLPADAPVLAASTNAPGA